MKTYSAGLLLLVLLTCSSTSCSAKVYRVGDSAGWSLSVDYTTWTSGKQFKLGDSLVFNYGSSHTVDKVSSGDYGSCTTGNSISSYSSSPTTVTLNTTGTHYFICGVVGHCSGGMKVSVPVTGDGGATATQAPASGTGGSSSSDKPTTTAGKVPSSSVIISPIAIVSLGLVSLVVKFGYFA